ncbi:MAG: GNAT family N-acetyltransferase [bacterium]|nr:GNAT family N-acetyltransferase [bacterium]
MTRTAEKTDFLKSEPFHIRRVTVDDAANLMKYLRGILSDPMASIADLDEMVLDSFREREHLRKLEMSDTGLGIVAVLPSEKVGNFFTVENRDEIVGFLTLEPTRRRKVKHVVELGMSVRVDWRARGVGRKLVEYAIEWAGQNGRIEKITLNVFSENKAALSLYESAGFIIEGRLLNQIKVEGRYQDLILMGRVTGGE